MTQVEGGLDEPTELEPEQGTLALADDADQHTRAEWEAAAAGVLRKARRMRDEDDDALVWDKLSRTTLDGIAVPPLGTADRLESLATSGRPTRQGDWDVRALHGDGLRGPDNEEVLVDLNGGVTSLWLRVGPTTDLTAVLSEVLLDLAPVVLSATGDGGDELATARAFLAHADGTELPAATNLGLDAAAATADGAELARAAGVRGFVVDATRVHDSGASDAQELGWSMAVAATYLRRLTSAGVDLETAADLVEFRYAVTDEQFPQIAKLRAARRLWSRVVELSGGGPVVQHQHAVTSRPMMSSVDPYVNMLRTTVATFAAGVGGADAVTVLPFDSPLGRPETLGRRVARNTSALLMWESHLARVADPAGGSYLVEGLTDDLAVAAWAELGLIESDGLDAFEERVAAVAEARDRLVARRTRPITGLTEFPQAGETPLERQADDGFAGVRAWGAPFEALRAEPVTTPVFLATMGPVAAHTARATFATNLLTAGGLAVEAAGATDGVEALVAAHDSQPVVCLAGTDAAYDEWGEQAAAALRGAGATWVVVAGKPRDWADDACALGVDALEFLTRTREKLS